MPGGPPSPPTAPTGTSNSPTVPSTASTATEPPTPGTPMESTTRCAPFAAHALVADPEQAEATFGSPTESTTDHLKMCYTYLRESRDAQHHSGGPPRSPAKGQADRRPPRYV